MEGKIANQKARDTYLNLLRECKDEYANRYGITRIGIFGSVARDEHNENSDLDICVETPPMGLLMPFIRRTIGCNSGYCTDA